MEKKRKPLNGIGILGNLIFWKIARNPDELSPKQTAEIRNLCNSDRPEYELHFMILTELLRLKERRFLRWLFKYWFNVEDISQMTAFVLPILEAKIFTKKKVTESKEWTFIQFIRLAGSFAQFNQTETLEHADSILSAHFLSELQDTYSDDRRPAVTEIFKSLSPTLKVSLLKKISEQFKTIVAAFPSVFNSAGEDSAGSTPAGAEVEALWFEAMRTVANEDILKMEPIANQPAAAVLYDLSQRIAQAEKLKNSRK